jgi:signal transduction histidine kinase
MSEGWNRHMRWSRALPLWIPFAVATLAAAGLLALSFFGLSRYREAKEDALEIEQLFGNTTALFAAVVEVTNAQRGYVVTGDEAFYAGYLDALTRIDGPLAAIVGQTSHTEREREVIADIEATVQIRKAALANNIRLVSEGRRDEAVADIESLRGVEQTELLRAQLDELVRLDAEEKSLGRGTASRLARQAEIGIAGLAVLIVLLLVYISWTFQRRSLEETLRRSNEAKDDFLGMVSHELRSPLTVILGNARMLQARYGNLTEEERGESLFAIEAEGRRLQQVVENMLTLSRTEKEGPVELEPVMLREAVHAAVRMHRFRFEGEVQVKLEQNLPVVMALPAYLHQVLENLLSNAAKYGGNEPIELEAKQAGGKVQICVRDRGPGIPQDLQERIFEPYVRLEGAVRRAEGLGLGLPVARRLVESQQGEIWVETPADGAGAAFCFTLQQAVMDDEEMPVQAGAAAQPN